MSDAYHIKLMWCPTIVCSSNGRTIRDVHSEKHQFESDTHSLEQYSKKGAYNDA